jgi:hypothetical protein
LSPIVRSISVVLLLAFVANAADAACMNRFVARTEGGTRQVVTLLTGKLTFQEAQEMAAKASFVWVDDNGKTIAKQFGPLKVVRPMPVGCDGKASGVVVIVTFASSFAPTKIMNLKLNAETTVPFEQQSDH